MVTLEENKSSHGGANESKAGFANGKRSGRNSVISIHSQGGSNAAARLSSPLRVTGIDTKGLRSKNKDKELATINRKTSKHQVAQSNAEADEYYAILAHDNLDSALQKAGVATGYI